MPSEAKSAAFQEGERRPPYLTICHITDHSACNLACPYCISSWRPDNKRFSPSILRAIIQRIREVMRPVSLVLGQWGEFFTSPTLMEETALLCNDPGNLAGVSILTNLYADWEKVIRPFAEGVDTGRLTMGCTLHDRVISEEEVGCFFEKTARLHAMGVLVYVNYIVTDDAAVAKAHSYKLNCDAIGVPLTLMPLYPSRPEPGAKQDFSVWLDALSTESLRELKCLCESPHAYRMLFDARTPFGMRCGAGSDYLYINAVGDMFPCCCGRSASYLGNIVRQGIVTLEQDTVCRESSCFHPYDMSALRIVDRRYTRTRDFRLIHSREGVSRGELESGYGMPLRLLRAAQRISHTGPAQAVAK